jgi:hypothetical protein
MKELNSNFCSLPLVILNVAVLRPVLSLVLEMKPTVTREAWAGTVPRRDQTKNATSATVSKKIIHFVFDRVFLVWDGACMT